MRRPVGPISDNAAVEAAQKGDREAFSCLVTQYSRYVFAVCYGILRSRHDAEDMTQQTFLKAFTSIRKLRHGAKFSPWIGRIARNLCIDFLRRQENRSASLEDLPEAVGQMDPVNPEYKELEDAVARLDERYRLPLLLYYFDGQSVTNVARALGVSRSAVHSRLSRARKELRGLLEEKEK